MPRQAVLWTLLLAALAGTSWLAWLRPDGDIIPLDRDGDPLPDYYLTGLTLRQYGPDGALARQLRANRLTRLPHQGTTLAQPRITVHPAGGTPWQVSATTGQVGPAGTLLTLAGEVLITRRASLGNRPMRLETRDLRYRLDEGYAETDEAVTVTSQRDRIDAVGLQAWLQGQDPGRIKFKSQVRGHYEP